MADEVKAREHTVFVRRGGRAVSNRGAGANERLLKNMERGAAGRIPEVDTMTAALERAFQVDIPMMDAKNVIANAKKLDKKVRNAPLDTVGPETKRAMIETLFKLEDRLEEILVDAQKENLTGLPIVEGLHWKKGDPLAGSTKAINPFFMENYWVVPPKEKRFTTADKKSTPIKRIKASEFPDEVVEVQTPKQVGDSKPKISDTKLLRRAEDELILRSKLPPRIIKRARRLLRKLQNPKTDDRVLRANLYLTESIGATYLRPIDDFTFRVRSQVLNQLQRAKTPSGILSAVRAYHHVVHASYAEASKIYSKSQVEGGRSQIRKAEKNVLRWIATQQRNEKSIYSCM